MKAFKITLLLYERDEDSDERTDSVVEIITVATSLSAAAAYAVQAYEKADGPMVDGFHWEAVSVQELVGVVALPAMKAIIPKT